MTLAFQCPHIHWKAGMLVLKSEDCWRVVQDAHWPASEEDRCNPPSPSTSQSGSVSPPSDGKDRYQLFCLFDGHNGTEAGVHCSTLLYKELHKRLPLGPVPDLAGKDARAFAFCQAIRRAFAETFLQLDMSFAERRVLSGCTATIVLVVGWVAFVANVGDSSCCLDTGRSVEQLNYDHRLEDSEEEQQRVMKLGGVLAKLDESGMGPAITNQTGYGPLRVWPGGLALSRAIGDFDVGPCISAMPNIRQVRLPKSGCRILVASDGLWDAFVTVQGPLEKFRSHSFTAVPEKLIDRALQLRGLADDITIICIDLTPTPDSTIPQLFGAKRGLFCCAAPKTNDDIVLQPNDSFSVLHDEDTSMHGLPSKDAYSGMDRGMFSFGDLNRLPVTLGGQYVDNRTEAQVAASKRNDASVKGGGYFHQLQEQPRERQVMGPNGQQGSSKQFSYHDVSVHMPTNSAWFQRQQAAGLAPQGPPTVHAGAAIAQAQAQAAQGKAHGDLASSSSSSAMQIDEPSTSTPSTSAPSAGTDGAPAASSAAAHPSSPTVPIQVPVTVATLTARQAVYAVEAANGEDRALQPHTPPQGTSKSAPEPTLADSDSDQDVRGSLRSDAGLLEGANGSSGQAPFAQVPSEKVGSTPLKS